MMCPNFRLSESIIQYHKWTQSQDTSETHCADRSLCRFLWELWHSDQSKQTTSSSDPSLQLNDNTEQHLNKTYTVNVTWNCISMTTIWSQYWTGTKQTNFTRSCQRKKDVQTPSIWSRNHPATQFLPELPHTRLQHCLLSNAQSWG